MRLAYHISVQFYAVIPLVSGRISGQFANFPCCFCGVASGTFGNHDRAGIQDIGICRLAGAQFFLGPDLSQSSKGIGQPVQPSAECLVAWQLRKPVVEIFFCERMDRLSCLQAHIFAPKICGDQLPVSEMGGLEVTRVLQLFDESDIIALTNSAIQVN